MLNNISEPITSHAINRGQHTAILNPITNEKLNYSELEHEIIKTSLALRELGIEKNMLVAISLKDSIIHVVIQLSLARIGCIHLPMDWRWGDEEKLNLITHFKPETIIVEDANSAKIIVSHLSLMNKEKVINVDKLIEASQIIENDFQLGKVDFFSTNQNFIANYSQNQPLLISLSSGTTGTPRGPQINHSHMISRFIAQSISLKFSWYDQFVAATPLYFGGGRTFVLSYLFMGGTIILLPPPWRPETFLKTLREYKPNVTFLVPTQIRDLLSLETKKLKDCATLTSVISSGSPLHENERKSVIDNISSGLIEYYASTEGGGISALFAKDMEESPSSVGKPIFRVEVQITDNKKFVQPPNTIGMVRYRGPAVTSKLFGEKNSKQKGETEDGWFYPGDLGELDKNGFLYLRGRSKDVIIRGGINIYPAEIEQTLLKIESINEAAVLGIKDERYGEIVAAVIAGKKVLDDENVKKLCSDTLATYKIPEKFAYVSELPKNSGGKIIKSELTKLFITKSWL